MNAADVQTAFGTVLRRAREERTITQEDLAHVSGVARSFIAKMEAGRRQPTITTVFRLAHALGVEPGVLLARTAEELGRVPAAH